VVEPQDPVLHNAEPDRDPWSDPRRTEVIDAPLGEPDGWGRKRRLDDNRSGAGGGRPTAGAGDDDRSRAGGGAPVAGALGVVAGRQEPAAAVLGACWEQSNGSNMFWRVI
jgi:hypothetical protein